MYISKKILLGLLLFICIVGISIFMLNHKEIVLSPATSQGNFASDSTSTYHEIVNSQKENSDATAPVKNNTNKASTIEPTHSYSMKVNISPLVIDSKTRLPVFESGTTITVNLVDNGKIVGGLGVPPPYNMPNLDTEGKFVMIISNPQEILGKVYNREKIVNEITYDENQTRSTVSNSVSYWQLSFNSLEKYRGITNITISLPAFGLSETKKILLQ